MILVIPGPLDLIIKRDILGRDTSNTKYEELFTYKELVFTYYLLINKNEFNN